MIGKYTNKNLEEESNPNTHNDILDFLNEFVNMEGRILDIGERNPLTEKIIKKFAVQIENSKGDLNYDLITDDCDYDLIICSHVIEHIPNVLTLLQNINSKIRKDGYLFLAWPIRLKKLYHHYHEIPLEDMYLLLSECGFRPVVWRVKPGYRGHKIGIRPFIRRYYDKDFMILAQKVE